MEVEEKDFDSDASHQLVQSGRQLEPDCPLGLAAIPPDYEQHSSLQSDLSPSSISASIMQRNTIFFCRNAKIISDLYIENLMIGNVDLLFSRDKKIIVLLDSLQRVQKLKTTKPTSSAFLFDTDWPMGEPGNTLENILKYCAEWKRVWSCNSIILLGISQFCTLCWHGLVSFEQIAYLIVENALNLTQNHMFTRVFKYFYFPLKLTRQMPRIAGFYDCEKIATSHHTSDPTSLQTFCLKVRFYQKELDSHCQIVEKDTQLCEKVYEFLGEEKKYPKLSSSLFCYSSFEHLLLLLNKQLGIISEANNESSSICLVAKDSYQASKLFAELLNTHSNGFLVLDVTPGKPMKYVDDTNVERVDFHFHRLWDSNESALKFIVIAQEHFSRFIGKNIPLNKTFFISNDSTYLFPSLNLLTSLSFYQNVRYDFWISNGENIPGLFKYLAGESLQIAKQTLYPSNDKLVQMEDIIPTSQTQSTLSSIGKVESGKNIFQFFYGSWIYMNETAMAIKSSHNVFKSPETGAILCYWNAAEILSRFCSCLPKYFSNESRQADFKTCNVAKSKDLSHFSHYFFAEVSLPQIKDLPLDSYNQLTLSTIKGKICTSKQESIQSAAFETCLLLIKHQLLDCNLLPTQLLSKICQEAESKFVFQRQSFNRLFYKETTEIVYDHLIPKVFQFNPNVNWNDTFYLYAIETSQIKDSSHSPNDNNSAKYTLDNNLQENIKLKSFLFDRFPPTQIANCSPFTVGIVTHQRLPDHLGSFPLAIPNPSIGNPKRQCNCTVTYLRPFTFKSKNDYHQMLQAQLTLYNFIATPIHMQELNKYLSQSLSINFPSHSNGDESKMMMYFLVPLTRNKLPTPLDFEQLFNLYLEYQSTQPIDIIPTSSTSSPSWNLDFSFFDCSDSTNVISLKDYKQYLKDWYDSRSYHSVEFQPFFIFCCKFFYHLRSYHPFLCKFSTYSTDDFPLSPFTCKSHPNCKTFAEFYQQKYQLTLTDFHTPLVKYKFIKGFEKVLFESSPNSPYTAPLLMSSLLPNGKKKRDSHSQGKASLVPDEFLLITSIPVGICSIVQLVPSVIHRLVNECLAYELYSSLTDGFKRFRNPPIPPLTLQGLTFSNANESFNYERLEFLGDTLLKFGTTLQVFTLAGRKSEAEMSELRSKQVSNSTLYRIALGNNFDWYCYPLSFYHRIWAPPQIESFYTNQHNGEETFSSLTQTIGHLFFNRNFYWNIRQPYVQSLSAKHQTTELDQDGNFILNDWIPPEYLHDRRAVPYTSKTMADLVEAFVGVSHVGHGNDSNYHDSMQALVELGILSSNPFSLSSTVGLIETELGLLSHSPINLLPGLDLVEERIGYRFKFPLLLQLAYTANTSSNNALTGGDSNSYERLEFLGDAVLDLMVVEYFYFKYASLTPNRLSECKMIMTNNLTFGTIFILSGLYFPLGDAVKQEVELFLTQLKDDESQDCPGSGGIGEIPSFYEMTVDCPKMFSDIFEAIAGAVWLDCNQDMSIFKRVFWPLLDEFAARNANPCSSGTGNSCWAANPVAQFLTTVQKFKITPDKITCEWTQLAPKEVSCAVLVSGIVIASCTATTKPLARKRAMALAQERFVRDGLYKQFIL